MKISIDKPISSEVKQGKDSSDGINDSRTKLMIAKNANLIKFKAQNLAKSKNNIKTNHKLGNSSFLISKIKKAFTKLRQVFIKAPMLTNFESD